MEVMTVAAIAVIEYEQDRDTKMRKTGEVLKQLCRESGETAEKIWEGMRSGKTLAEAKRTVMTYARENDGCTEEDAKRILRELYGVAEPRKGAKAYDVV